MPISRTRLLAAVITVAVLVPGSTVAQDDAASPGPVPSSGAAQLGATDEIYQDAFDVTPGWLDLGEDESGRTALEDGQVYMSVIGPDANYWDDVTLPEAAGAMRVEATVQLDSNTGTAAGPACGSSAGLPRWFVAGVTGDGWWLGRLIDGRLQVIDRGSLDAGAADGSAVRVAIECASAPADGGDLVLIAVDDQLVDASMPVLDIPVGPYDKAGLLVATDEHEGSATFDDMVVYTGEPLAQ